MSLGIEPSLRSTCRLEVFSNHRWLTLVLTRNSGVRSKSAPAPTNTVPGLLKFDCPSSFDERSEFNMPLRPLIAIARSEEHTSELQSLMRISYAVFCLKKKKKKTY